MTSVPTDGRPMSANVNLAVGALAVRTLLKRCVDDAVAVGEVAAVIDDGQ